MDEKKISKIAIPRRIRFPLAWTIFFTIIGIVIQSIYSKNFVFLDFFAENYIEWFRSFGSFVEQTQYNSIRDMIFTILNKWYYFLYTGGLISLIWSIIMSIINSEINFTREIKQKDKYY